MLHYYMGVGPGNVSLMRGRSERAGVVTIPLEEYQGYLFCFRNFGLMTTYDDTHLGQELWKLVDLASRPVHLARLHFGVLFDNKLYCEETPSELAAADTT